MTSDTVRLLAWAAELQLSALSLPEMPFWPPLLVSRPWLYQVMQAPSAIQEGLPGPQAGLAADAASARSAVACGGDKPDSFAMQVNSPQDNERGIRAFSTETILQQTKCV